MSDKVVDICHTFVDESLRGQGIADKLVRAVIAEIQPKEYKIRTSCPYAKTWFSSHPEYADLMEQ
ncbi:MAG TPA: N-acetyltransferase [Clostridiales bacterium]|nr:N-acetyltransferase [Clostridiales bacterium]